MSAAGVRAVAIDVYHLDRGAALEDLPANATEAQKAKLLLEQDDAEMFREALQENGRVVAAFKLTDVGGTQVPARVEAASPKLAPPVPFDGPPGIVLPGAELPVTRVSKGAALLGFASATADPDAVIRRGATVGRWGDRPVVSLSLAAALLATEGDRAIGPREIRLGGATQRIAEDGTYFVNWRREREPYARVR